jgi:hypothetical protein
MRKVNAFIIGAALLIPAPAVAQNNAASTADTVGAAGAPPESAAAAGVPGTGTANNLDSDLTTATAPVNGLTAGPGAAPETTAPGAVDLAYGEPARERDNDRFPWGLLGLAGLAGLLGRKRKDRDEVRRDTTR